MKKSVILSILGLAAATGISYGQGAIEFNTYLANNSAGILTTYGQSVGGATQGTGVDSTFTGWLVWSTTNPGDVATTSPGAAAQSLNASLFTPGNGNASGGAGVFDSGSAAVPGYIAGSNLNITGAVGTSLYFELVAFNGPTYGAAGFWSGHSASFQATLATGSNLPDPNQLNGLSPFSVYFVPVPEPATMALGGLGLASLLVFRRKKA